MYYSTDLCVFVVGDGLEDPPTGNFLGDLTDELDRSDEVVIGECVCGGPKNYSSLLTTYKRAGVMTTFERINSIKCKGMVDTVARSWKVNFDELRDLILESYKERSCEENPTNETVTLNSLLLFKHSASTSSPLTEVLKRTASWIRH